MSPNPWGSWARFDDCDPAHNGGLPDAGGLFAALGVGRAARGFGRHRSRSLRRARARLAWRATAYALWLATRADGRAGAARARVPRGRLVAGADEQVPAPRGLPHLSRRHPRQRRLHAGRRRPARGAARGDHPAPRFAGAHRRAQPRRDARPRRRRASARPRRRDRHDGQPGARARGTPQVADAQRRPARTAQPRRHAQPDGRGLRGRALRPGELRPGPGRAADRVWTSPRSTPGATASSTGGRASTRPRVRSRCARPTWAWRSTPPSSPSCRPRCGRWCRQLSKSIVERSRSFESRCSAVIDRTVPLRERITRECVVMPSPR